MKSDQDRSAKPKRKNLLPLLALTAMLILAPLGSWLYLKLGIDYRMNALEELAPKDLPSDVRAALSPLLVMNSKAKLVHINDLESPVAADLLSKLDERIVDKNYFEIITLSVNEAGGSITNYAEIGEIAYGKNLLLFDTSNLLRAEYNLTDDVGKEVIRHLAVVIPIPKQKNEVQLKRDVENEN